MDRSRKGEKGRLCQKQQAETNQVDETLQVTNSFSKSANRGALESAIQSRELWSTARCGIAIRVVVDVRRQMEME